MCVWGCVFQRAVGDEAGSIELLWKGLIDLLKETTLPWNPAAQLSGETHPHLPNYLSHAYRVTSLSS